MTTRRFELLADPPRDVRSDFAAAVLEGLGARAKFLPCQWLYDAEGSQLFEEICALEEYYPTRAEAEILRDHAAAIVAESRAALGPGERLTCFELGSGSAEKTRHVLAALIEAQGSARYVPVDISRAAVEESAMDLLAAFPTLEVVGIAGEYARGFEWLDEHRDEPKLALWLGGNIGNLDRRRAAEFVRTLGEHLSPRDRLLLGIDLRKERAVLEAAYDDPSGVTERFIKNVFVRMRRELGSDIDPEDFDYVARYDEVEGRVTMHLVARRAHAVHVGEQTFTFEAGERVHVEDSTKYAPEEIDRLAAAAGFEVQGRWLDEEGRFSDTLLSRKVSLRDTVEK